MPDLLLPILLALSHGSRSLTLHRNDDLVESIAAIHTENSGVPPVETRCARSLCATAQIRAG
jgi:hypothetical protein